MKNWGKILIVVAILIAIFSTIGIYSSREVLSAFGTINQKLEEANTQSVVNKDSLINQIQNNSFKIRAIFLKDVVQEFHEDLEDHKEKLLNNDIGEDYSKADMETVLFVKDGHITENGTSFIASMNQMRRDFVNNAPEDSLLLNKINEFFPRELVNSQEKRESWLRYHFEGFPIITSVTKLTSIQNDVQAIESQILTRFLSQKIPDTQ
ncbi:hypothetical protein [uncultured Dokdonia sp.]|uniref:hypothetical protein n=1 Tax=uncultured Dokdonia sp. TaxID=575653 RepID=UPI002630EBA7|nr:hypothetical protein [uncultured Dokdonia sp.]